MGVAADMARTSSGRKGRGDAPSEANLLTPLPSAGDRGTTEPPDIRHVLEAIQELRASVAVLPSPAATEVENLRQVSAGVAASVDALRLELGKHEDRNAESAGRIEETLAAIQQAIGGLAAKLEAAPGRGDPAPSEGMPDDIRTFDDLLEVQAKALQEMRNAVDRLARALEASQAETAGLRQAFERADSPGSDLRALDAWRDDFIRYVDALLATVRTEGGAQAAREDAGRETALVDVGGLTARMGEAFDAFETTLKRHGESLRRNENSSLLTRKGVESLTAAFGRSGREYRRWRLSWASPLILLVAFAAGMLLESNVHWFYAWLSGR